MPRNAPFDPRPALSPGAVLTALPIALSLVALALPPLASANPAMPGGDTTHTRADNRNSFSHFAPNLRPSEQMTFKLGNAIFRKVWVASPASTTSSDGLGPNYNARSCQRCHVKDGRGTPPGTLPVLGVSGSVLALRQRGGDGESGDPVYGGQLQDFAVTGLAAEGLLKLVPEAVERHGQPLRQWRISIEALAQGPLDARTAISLRTAPHMIGLGLLEAIPAAHIRAGAAAQNAAAKRRGDGVSGRAAERADGRLGRFGWKAHSPSVRAQSSGAFHADMGLSTPARPDPAGDCTAAQRACREAPHGGTPDAPEVSEKLMRWVTFYASHLAPPHRPDAEAPAILAGEQLFHRVGCAVCHRPSWQTGESDFPALAHQTIYPYTDLLLHDMGPGLDDGAPAPTADSAEWRTPPLWGLGRIRTVNGHLRLLHDGRADGVSEAIAWHGGEGESSATAFFALDAGERALLVDFVESL